MLSHSRDNGLETTVTKLQPDRVIAAMLLFQRLIRSSLGASPVSQVQLSTGANTQ
jgi:hypothetical protein